MLHFLLICAGRALKPRVTNWKGKENRSRSAIFSPSRPNINHHEGTMNLSRIPRQLGAWGACMCINVLLAGPAHASDAVRDNVVNLSADAAVEVKQDLLSVRLTALKEGGAASEVQEELKRTLEAALAECKKTALEGAMEVRTSNFSLYPRYGRDGRINGWQGRAELILQGTDAGRIGQAAGRVNAMTIVEASYGLSRRLREQREAELTQQAIQAFRGKAASVAKAFGFSAFSLGEINVQTVDVGGGMPIRAMAMAKGSLAEDGGAPLPTEAGKTNLSVSVSGSVILTR